jgi:hypothetical protein
MERRIIISSSRFHQLVGISQSSALNIFKKITTVVESHMQEASVKVPSAVFTFAICKRSRETPAKKHPFSEEEEMEKLSSAEASQNPASDHHTSKAQAAKTTDMKLDRNEQEIVDILSTEPIHVDLLCQRSKLPINKILAALTMLELAGMATRLAGDRYIRQHTTELAEQKVLEPHTAISNQQLTHIVNSTILFIRHKFHGISRKFLQNYLAAYWLEFSKTRWKSGSLLNSCWQFGPISPKQICAYISPLLVRVLVNQH